MSEVIRIEPGHPDYNSMALRATVEGGKRLQFGGAEWLIVRDNDKMVFVKTQSLSSINSAYDSSSMPKHD